MPNVRPLNKKKYGISKHAFMTAYSFCLQYQEWKEELETKTDTMAAPNIDGLPGTHGDTGDATAALAAHRLELREKIEKVEKTVREATEKDPGLYWYLLEYVITEGATFRWIKQKGVPCERTYFYKMRRYFYYLMARKI